MFFAVVVVVVALLFHYDFKFLLFPCFFLPSTLKCGLPASILPAPLLLGEYEKATSSIFSWMDCTDIKPTVVVVLAVGFKFST